MQKCVIPPPAAEKAFCQEKIVIPVFSGAIYAFGVLFGGKVTLYLGQ